MTNPAAMTMTGCTAPPWDAFFKMFDENALAFLHDPASDSRFSKFVADETADRGGPPTLPRHAVT